MSLRRQLIIVSLLLLTLPWAGCQFLREMEGALRQGHARALDATASAIAASLNDQPGALYPHPQRLDASADPAGTLYAPALEDTLILDGYDDGWPDAIQGRFRHPDGVPSLAYRAAVQGETLYLLLQVGDHSLTYHNPGLSQEPNGDRLLLRTWLDGARQEYLIATPAPGSVRARHAGRRHPATDARRIRGYWQDTVGGYAVELALPLAMTGGRLGIQAIDVDRSGASAVRTVGNIEPLQQTAPPWLVYAPPELHTRLDRFAAPAQHILVTDRRARLLARTRGPEAATTATPVPETFWLLRILYRRILADTGASTAVEAGADGFIDGREIRAALAGQQTQHWYRDNGDSRRTLSAAAPIRSDGVVIGSVVVRQSSEQYLSLTDRAFSRLLGYSLTALAIAATGLLGFASLLSWRIRRLSRAAGRVLGESGLQLSRFPRSRARDEIGDLSRSFGRLLDELHDYNEYLRTLSRKLSHELRTPIAVIQSSLDNLEHGSDSEAADAVYVSRARGGLTRLSHILNAMTEASRVEESIRQRDMAAVDLVPLLQDITQAYREIYPHHRLNLQCPQSAVIIQGVGELIVQALDKLMDNAASFTPAGSAIDIALQRREDDWEIQVCNEGPPLPGDMQGRLFEAMISLREARAADTVHLGLGLYIVKLVADYHHGSVHARNRADGQGACFILALPATPSEGA
ncbi:proteobacterial dedicated sortase system histidine kinase [Kineobactrum salinum]|uniref:histidine kinase n=1 Tax=Kineobactrum salinum TaxID=2708301 RepID=A0A6C0U5D0_9GAMM|nr:proteobacterial dedicated sortase system histidine kinase [Kineobactrum salinum]QIB64654.1 proteobacterial dedicated sortase system histidine kinase [Kineobactrum salinum]